MSWGIDHYRNRLASRGRAIAKAPRRIMENQKESWNS